MDREHKAHLRNLSSRPEHPKLNPNRPQRVIDLEVLKQYAAVGMPDKELAEFYNVKYQYFTDNFGFITAEMRQQYKFDIRSKQLELAMNGSERLLVHLGKAELGQSETIKQELSTPTDSGPLQVEHNVLTAPKGWKPQDEV